MIWLLILRKSIKNFIKGLQGAGKSTMVRRLSEQLPEYKVFREGDYSPVELAWCAYVTEPQYQDILMRYPSMKNDIDDKTIIEGDHRIICYTRILTDIVGFHKDFFECSIFQNIIENQILYLMMSDEEILDFYCRLKQVLSGKQYQIIYLDVDDICSTIELIKKERSDENGNELWFPLMTRYVEESPYGKAHSLHGMEGLIIHLERRKSLEHRIINEIFKNHTIIAKSKDYNLKELLLM